MPTPEFHRRPRSDLAAVRLLVDGWRTGRGLGPRRRRAGLATSPQLERTLDESAARLVVLDMRDLGFMDCSGVHAIVEASHRARERRPPADPPARDAERRPRVRAHRQRRRGRDRRHRAAAPPARPAAPPVLRRDADPVSATAPLRGPPESVPIEHETSERVVRTLVFALPPAALAGRRLAGVGRHAALARPDRARDHLHAVGIRDHGRLPPPLHPPQLQDHARGPRAAGRVRLDGGRGPGDRVGLDAPQAPPLLGRARRPAQPPRRPGAGMARRAARASPTRTSAGCSAARTWPTRPATRRTCSPTATCASSAAPSRSGRRSAC